MSDARLQACKQCTGTAHQSIPSPAQEQACIHLKAFKPSRGCGADRQSGRAVSVHLSTPLPSTQTHQTAAHHPTLLMHLHNRAVAQLMPVICRDDTAQNIDLQKCLHAQQTVDKDKNMCQELSPAPVGLGLCQPNTDTTAASHALHDCLSLNRRRTNILAILLHHTNACHNTTLTNHKQQTDATSHILAHTHTATVQITCMHM